MNVSTHPSCMLTANGDDSEKYLGACWVTSRSGLAGLFLFVSCTITRSLHLTGAKTMSCLRMGFLVLTVALTQMCEVAPWRLTTCRSRICTRQQGVRGSEFRHVELNYRRPTNSFGCIYMYMHVCIYISSWLTLKNYSAREYIYVYLHQRASVPQNKLQ